MSRTLAAVSVIIVLMISLIVGPAIAKGKNGPKGKSLVGHLYLFEKNPDTWEVVDGGAWGKMKYNLRGDTFDFVFNGHGVESGQSYTLIYYPDPWPGDGLICLGEGTAVGFGNVHIKNKVDTGDMPAEDDENFSCGAKIWLVLTEDVDVCCEGETCEEENSSKMVGWNPEEYLFEYNLIKFDDTDDTNDTDDTDNMDE